MNFTLKGNTTVIASLRHSGKSELARMLILKEKKKFDSIFVISPIFHYAVMMLSP